MDDNKDRAKGSILLAGPIDKLVILCLHLQVIVSSSNTMQAGLNQFVRLQRVFER